MGSAGAVNDEFHEKRGKNIPQEPLFSPDWQQDCRILSWQKLTPHQHTGQAKETKDTQPVRQSEMTEWVLGRSRCSDGALSVLRGLTLCRYLWKNNRIQRFYRQTLVLSLQNKGAFVGSLLTSAGDSCRSDVISTQRSYKSCNFLKSRVSCRRCSCSFPKRSWYIAWLWVTPLGSWIKDTKHFSWANLSDC